MARIWSPNISRAHLVLAIDANAVRSVRDITTPLAIDITGKSLVRSSDISGSELTSNIKSLIFTSASNSMITVNVNEMLSFPITIEFFAKIATLEDVAFVSFAGFSVLSYDSGIYVADNIGNFSGVSGVRVSDMGLLNSWHQYVFVIGADISQCEVYIDGIKPVQDRGLPEIINISNKFIIGADNNASKFADMHLANFKLYNKIMSDEEIFENYNALKNLYQ